MKGNKSCLTFCIIFFALVNCEDPSSPDNGSLDDYAHTREGAVVTYRCNDGYRPSQQRSSTCNSTGDWDPPPEQHVCTFVEGIVLLCFSWKCSHIPYCIATVSIIPLEPITSREDIHCPGDIIPFNCSILSNSETIHLTWSFAIPGMVPIADITYSNITSGSDLLTSYISTSVTGFQSDQYIHSTLEFTVQFGIPILQINLMCAITSLGFNTTVVLVNSSCKSYLIYAASIRPQSLNLSNPLGMKVFKTMYSSYL